MAEPQSDLPLNARCTDWVAANAVQQGHRVKPPAGKAHISIVEHWLAAPLSMEDAWFRDVLHAIPDIVFVASCAGEFVFRNQRWHDYCGTNTVDNADWFAALHPEDLHHSRQAWWNAIHSGQIFEHEHRLRSHQGCYRWFLTRAVPQRSKTEDTALHWIGTSTDITLLVQSREIAERRQQTLETRLVECTTALTHAAAELRAEVHRRQAVQLALLQSQKLQTLGHLTASVSHDFNNVLNVILGTYELIERGTQDSRLIDLAANGKAATNQAVVLVRQLLTFGRRDALTPVVLNTAAALRAATNLLHHAIGPTISHTQDIPGDLWPVIADPHQLEIALLNLGVNARDAMPNGGTLSITARNLPPTDRPGHLHDQPHPGDQAHPRDQAHPGDQGYVAIAVQDSGTGMTADVQARATEPFFTTKPEGKGTGLGLSMVHDFATGAGGYLRIDSPATGGTLIQIILPRAAVLT